MSAARWHWIWVILAWASLAEATAPTHLMPTMLQSAKGERWVLTQYLTIDGLPQNSVSSMAQDPDGYLWLATFGGLTRFDGKRFKPFGTAQGLPANRIHAVVAAADGEIWVGTEADGVFRGGSRGFVNAEICRCTVHAIAQGANGDIWIASSAGLYLHQSKFANTQRVVLPDGATPLRISAEPEPVYVADHRSVYEYTAKGFREVHAERQGVLHLIGRDSRGGLLIGSNELTRWDGQILDGAASGFRGLGIGSAWARYDDGRLAFAARQQLSLYKANEPSANDQLVTDRDLRPLSALVDDQQTLWVGTDGYGLLKLRPAQVRLLSSRGGALRGAFLNIDFDPASGDFWVGPGCSPVARVSPAGVERVALPGLPYYCAMSLLRDGARLWIGGSGFEIREVVDGDVLTHPFLSGAAHQTTRALFRASDGGLYAGTDEGLYRLADGGFDRVLNGPTASIAAIGEWPDKQLYTAGAEGLWVRTAGTWRAWVPEARHARSVHRAADGALWIGTYGDGLHLLTAAGHYQYTRNDGLAEEIASCVIADHYGRIWLSGNRGIYGYAEAQLRARAAGGPLLRAHAISEADGMLRGETNGGGQPRCARDQEGVLWFPTLDGIVGIDPRLENAVSPPPKVLIEEVLANGVLVATQPASTIDLPAGSASLVIRYTAVSLRAPDQLRFRYRLEGQGQFQDLGGDRELAIAVPRVAQLALEFEAIDADGNTSPPTALAVRIRSGWESQSWNWLVLFVALGFSPLFVILGRRFARRFVQAEIEAQTRMRTTALEEALTAETALRDRDTLSLGLTRSAFLKSLRARLAGRAQPSVLVLYDIDTLALYNREYGATDGDHALRRIAQVIQAARGTGLVGRTDGDEFALWLDEPDPLIARQRAAAVVESIRGLNIPHALTAAQRVLTVSAGLTIIDGGELDADEVLTRASLAVGRAKLGGGNQLSSGP